MRELGAHGAGHLDRVEYAHYTALPGSDGLSLLRNPEDRLELRRPSDNLAGNSVAKGLNLLRDGQVRGNPPARVADSARV